MENVMVLAYRNNDTWAQLNEALVFQASKYAEKQNSRLIVKVFPADVGIDIIDHWITSIMNEYDVVYHILDDTVADRFKELSIELPRLKWGSINRYLTWLPRVPLLKVPIEQIYCACFERITDVIKPDLWVIVSRYIGDYDPLGLKLQKRSSEEVDEYLRKFKSFIPKNQNVAVVSGKDDYYKLDIKDKRVIVFCHHHVQTTVPGIGSEEEMLSGAKKGSMILNTYPLAFLPLLTGIIPTNDLIGGDWIELIREEMMK